MDKKLKSLLFREMKICRKSIIITSILVLGYMVMMLFSVYSLKNDAEMTEKAMTAVVETAIMMVAMLGTLFGLADSLSGDEVMKTDINTNWLSCSYSLPITAKVRAAVRLIRRGLLFGFGIAVSDIVILIICAYTDRPLRVGYFLVPIFIIDLLMMSRIISEQFMLRARTKDEFKSANQKGGVISTAVVAAAAYTVLKASGIIKQMRSNLANVDIFAKITPVTALIAAAILVGLVYIKYVQTAALLGTAAGMSKRVKAEKSEVKESVGTNRAHTTGLLFKEMKQNQAVIAVTALLPVISALFGIFFMFMGEKIDETELTNAKKLMTIRIVMAVFSAFIGSHLIAGIFQGDDRKLWAYFISSTPVGVRSFIYGKYVLTFAMAGALMTSMIMTDTAVSTIYFALTGLEAPAISTYFILTFFVLIGLSCVDIPLVLRFGSRRGPVIKLIALIVFTIGLLILFENLPESSKDRVTEFIADLRNGTAGDTPTMIFSMVPAAVLGGYFLSYKASCRLYMKGAEGYDK